MYAVSLYKSIFTQTDRMCYTVIKKRGRNMAERTVIFDLDGILQLLREV